MSFDPPALSPGGAYPTVGVDPIFPGGVSPVINIGDNGLFLEYAAKIQIQRYLPEEITRQETFWRQRLTVLATQITDTKLPAPTIKPVQLTNIFVGPRPSLLRASIDFWPSVTIRSGDMRPNRYQGDNWNVFDLDFYIEVMTYAGPISPDQLHEQAGIDAEGEANFQTHLLSNAVQMCIARDPTLGGVAVIENAPSIRPSFPTAVPGNNQERTGDLNLYQGRQLHYVMQTDSF